MLFSNDGGFRSVHANSTEIFVKYMYVFLRKCCSLPRMPKIKVCLCSETSEGPQSHKGNVAMADDPWYQFK